MTDYEDLLRQDARRRGWRIEAHQNRITVGDVPYRKKDARQAGVKSLLKHKMMG